MIARCSNPKQKSYYRYGGRGIRVCERWLTYELFLADMGERPEGKTLDRKDVNKDYSPENCRWATLKEQSNNRRDCNYHTHSGQTKTVTEWAATIGMSRAGLNYRLKTLSIAEALIRSGSRVRKRKHIQN